MAIPEIIYCADGNERFARIAIDAGFTFGAQLPNTVYYPPEFTDQNWKAPNLDQEKVYHQDWRLDCAPGFF